MRAHQEIWDDAKDGQAFSNGTEWEIWSYNWCERCKNDANEDCPLIATGFAGRIPVEWMRQPVDSPDRYHCIEFRSQDDPPGDGWHRPENPPPGQGELFPREGFEGVRMFADVVAEAAREAVPS